MKKVLRSLMKHKILLIVTIVVCVCCSAVNVFAEENENSDSSFVTYSDGTSYSGLPDFPTTAPFITILTDESEGCYYNVVDYVLYYVPESAQYYLLCVPDDYKDVINSHYVGGTGYVDVGSRNMHYYYPNGTVKSCSSGGNNFAVYNYDSASESWCYLRNYGSNYCISLFDCYDILSSTFDIYTDNNCTEVFTARARDLLVANLSSKSLTQMMTQEMAGLIPSVIGLLILVLAFWKGWKMLRQALQMA